MNKLFKNIAAMMMLSVTIASIMPISTKAIQSVTIPNTKNDATNESNSNNASSTVIESATNTAPTSVNSAVNTEGIQVEESSENSIRKQEQTTSGELEINEPLDNSVPVIYKYEVEGDGYITPGEEFTLKFTVYNPAVVTKLGNISIEITQDDNLVYPTYKGTNSVYLGYLTTLSYAEGQIKLMASKNITEDELVVNLNLIYTDNYSRNNTQRLTAVLPVSPSGKLNIDNVEMPTNAQIGGNNRIKVTYSNNSLSVINNLVLHLNVAEMEEQTIDLGSIGSGSSLTSDVYAEFATSGDQSASLKFTYNDQSGQEYETDDMTYNINVEDYDDTEEQAERAYVTKRNIMNMVVTILALLASLFVLGMNFRKHFKLKTIVNKCKNVKKKVIMK